MQISPLLREPEGNTGHGFLNKSVGDRFLGKWVHNITGLEYLPSLATGEYEVRVARAASGLQSYKFRGPNMSINMAIIASGEKTIGVL